MAASNMTKKGIRLEGSVKPSRKRKIKKKNKKKKKRNIPTSPLQLARKRNETQSGSMARKKPN